MSPVIQSLPGGVRVASGGTRIAVNLDRPWQADISVNPETCPFDTKQQAEIARIDDDGGWRILENRFTPYSWHLLVIPQKCWPKDEVRTLGGDQQIATALRLAVSHLAEQPEVEYWLGVHVGPLAGQNIGHVHYHLLCPLGDDPGIRSGREVVEHFQSSQLVLLDEPPVKVVLGGMRAGQCFIFPHGELRGTTLSEPELASVLSKVISMYRRGFTSLQGLPPDYIIGLTFWGTRLTYGTFIPILNNWGFTEYVGLLERTPLILPWPHEVTLRHLKGP